MLLTIDVGNTNAVMCLFGDPSSDDVLDHWRAASDVRRTSDEWMLLVHQFLAMRGSSPADIEGVVISSGVPRVTTNLQRMCARLGLSPLIVRWDTPTGMPVLLDDPREIGPDRIANGVAAFEAERTATIVVDLGTATTLDVVSNDGEFLGGVILPGIEISLDALFDRAAALRRIDLTVTERVIGTSTATAVRSGSTHGFAAQIDGLCERVERELGPCRVIATGGLSATVTSLSTRIHRQDPWLTLQGLRLIYQRNQS